MGSVVIFSEKSQLCPSSDIYSAVWHEGGIDLNLTKDRVKRDIEDLRLYIKVGL